MFLSRCISVERSEDTLQRLLEKVNRVPLHEDFHFRVTNGQRAEVKRACTAKEYPCFPCPLRYKEVFCFISVSPQQIKRCWGQNPPTMMPTDCFVLRTPTILPAIRISWCLRPTFMLISGRVSRSFYHQCASTRGFRPFDPDIIILMSGDTEEIIYEKAKRVI